MVPDSPTKRRAILRCEGASTTSPIRLDGDGSLGIVGIISPLVGLNSPGPTIVIS